jgi:WD40 repeat protein
VLQLAGLPVQAGQALLQAQGLDPTERTASALVQQYSGNPLALQIVSRTILDLYNGDIEAFTHEGFPIFDNIRTVLDQQFERLSELERELLIWLAIEREAVTATVLRTNLVDKGSQRAFLEALRSLQQRSLLEKINDGFTLQNVVIEYVTEHLVETVCAELINFDKVTRGPRGRPGDKVNEEHTVTLSPSHPVTVSLFNRHALLKAQSKDYVRESQRRLILQPVGEQLLVRFGRGELRRLLYQYLDRLRKQLDQERPAPGYAAGNLLNLALHRAVELSRADFSTLAVWQADLRGAYIPGLNFAGADLTGSVFTQVFSALYAIQFDSENGLVVAEVSGSHLSLRNIATDSVINEYALHGLQIHALLLSPGLRLAALVSLSGVHLFDLAAGEILHTLAGHHHRIWRYRFDDEGALLATGDAGGQVCVWHCATGELLYTLSGVATAVTAIAFSPNSQLLASATIDGTVFLWELTSGALIQTLRGHAEEVAALEFALDGTLLATGSHDTTVGLWSVADGQLLHRLVGHTQPIRRLATAGAGRLLVSGGGDPFVYVWDMSSGRAMHILSGHASTLDRLSISPDGRTVATVDLNDVVSLWDIQRGLRVNAYPIYRNVIWALAFSPDGERMATGGADAAIYLWDARPGQPAQIASRLPGYQHRAMTIAFHADGKTVASADGDAIHLWDVQAGRLLHTLHGHSGVISRLAFHPAGHQLASSSGDRTLCLWSIERGQKLRQMRGHTSVVTCCNFSPPVGGGLSEPLYLLASGSLDQTVLLWDAQTGKLRHTLRGHTNAVTDCVFSPDGQYLFSASYDQTMRMWRVQTGQLVATWPTPGTVYFSLAMHPSGKVVAAAGDDPVIRLVAVDNGRILGEFHGHSRDISSIHFSPDGERLASTSWDETIKLWAVTESAADWRGSCLQTVKTPGPYAGTNIAGVTGISAAQKAALLALGAIEV